ncbi:MAG: transglycosylase SLT domain-containing protein [Burkholderiaceae bacterium]
MTLNLKPLRNSVYGWPTRPGPWAALLIAASLLAAGPVARAQGDDATIVEARDALRKSDRARLALLRFESASARHPLAMWPDYWDITNRIDEVRQDEIDAFNTRWSGTYVEDRLRNDWLLVLGKRRDWANFVVDFPRFRMNDDRDVTCYALLTEHLAGKKVRDAALDAWLTQRDTGDGCGLLATTLTEAKVFTAADAWRKARLAIDASRPRSARDAAALVNEAAARAVGELTDNPARYLARNGTTATRQGAELTALALVRMATKDLDVAVAQLTERWDRSLPADLSAWVWAAVAKQSAFKLQNTAPDQFQTAVLRASKTERAIDLPDDTLAWKARAALRADNGRARWQQVMQAINAMSEDEQRDPAWVYWKARALMAMAADSQDGESMRRLAREQMAGIAGQMNFYAALASENLGQPIFMPPRPLPLSAAEREAAAGNPGLVRALKLVAMGLRSEGVREWNYTLRGMKDRELLAAAQLACDREVWDRCINTSDRTRDEIDMEQRFPMPFRAEVTARAKEIGLDPAYVYGLIRQESRFIMDARSGVGASGLMQIMPATARWTAKKIGMDFRREQIADRDVNIKLGTAYLKLVLDDFDGSQALAAAAYNAGPSRSRRWREGPSLETAVWAENVPFSETRDYVKKVLSNASYYAAQMNGAAPTLKGRLGAGVAPADANSVAPNKDLP